jgi:rod shape-determining protein MreD
VQDRFGVSIGRVFGAMVPFGFALLGAMIANFPVTFTSGVLPTPLFALMPVYFWGLLRPDLMPHWVAFAVGLAEDLLSGGPPGIWAAAFVASYAFVDRQRDSLAGLAGLGAILGFAVALFVALGTAYAIVALYYLRIPPPTPLMADLAVNVLWYIPVLVLMNLAQHHLIGALRSEL